MLLTPSVHLLLHPLTKEGVLLAQNDSFTTTIKNYLGVYSYSQTTLIFYSSFILIFDFDWILGSVLTFWGPNVLFLGLGKGSETVLGSPHID